VKHQSRSISLIVVLCLVFLKLANSKLLQTQDLRVDQEKEPCIRVNTRELDRGFGTELSILYTKTPWSVLTTSSLL